MTKEVKGFLVIALVVAAGLLTYLSCKGQPSSLALSAPPLAPGCPADNPPSTYTQLQACLAGLDFDTVPGAGDYQRLMINPPCPGSCRHGPLARIQPEKRAHENDNASLERGRFLAVLMLDSTETQPYPKLNLVPGKPTYWWVRKTSSSGGRSVFISTDTAQQSVASYNDTLVIDPHPSYQFKQALAKWHWSDNDEQAWATCKKDGCCR